MMIWEEDVRRRYRPHLFTAEAWATLSEQQRDLIGRQRRAVVQALALDHQRRYHGTRNLVTLGLALEQDPHDAA